LGVNLSRAGIGSQSLGGHRRCLKYRVAAFRQVARWVLFLFLFFFTFSESLASGQVVNVGLRIGNFPHGFKAIHFIDQSEGIIRNTLIKQVELFTRVRARFIAVFVNSQHREKSIISRQGVYEGLWQIAHIESLNRFASNDAANTTDFPDRNRPCGS
jgi:desulfoferrodoxin (superoxide reductase-like protein)